MGAGASLLSLVGSPNGTIQRSTTEIVALLMPVYFVEDEPCEADIEIAKRKWQLILDNTSPHFLKKKGEAGYTQSSCIGLFYDSFYQRLFDIHPMCKPMFKAGLKSQGKFLVKMISMALTILLDKEKFSETMSKLAEVHNNRGVKAIEYGIIGDVMFWSLRRCLGPEYDESCHRAWVRIFCSMLKILVPNAITWELRNGEAQIQRLRTNVTGISSTVSETSSVDSA